MPKTLKFLAVDDRLVFDCHAAEAGARRYVARSFEPSKLEDASLVDHWPAAGAVDYQDVPSMAFALGACRSGDLLAGDAYTAKRAGVAAPKASTAKKGSV